MEVGKVIPYLCFGKIDRPYEVVRTDTGTPFIAEDGRLKKVACYDFETDLIDMDIIGDMVVITSIFCKK